MNSVGLDPARMRTRTFIQLKAHIGRGQDHDKNQVYTRTEDPDSARVDQDQYRNGKAVPQI